MALTQTFFAFPRLSFGCSLKRVSKRGILASGLILTLMGCTPEHGVGPAANKAGDTAVAAKTSMVGLTSTVACNPDDVAHFDRVAGELVDLDRENLPRGLFLATQAEMLIEKKPDAGQSATRVIVREENVGKGAEIVCAEGLERLGADFEIALTGLVKFVTTDKPEGSGFTLRQFFFFQDKDGYGVVLSNPKQLASRTPLDIRKLLRSSPGAPQLFRNGDRAYTLRYLRERDGVRGQLLVRLEVD